MSAVCDPILLAASASPGLHRGMLVATPWPLPNNVLDNSGLFAGLRDHSAGCGEHAPSSSRLKRYDPAYPTFDHVTTRSTGGGRTLGNGLLKHQRCNQNRANRAPTGCDLIWLEFVMARLSMRPKSFKPTFKGGVRNPR